MAHRWLIVTTCVLVVAVDLPALPGVGLNFTPDEDESRFQVSVRLPVGSSLAATQSLLDRIVARRAAERCPACSPCRATPASTGGGQGGNNSGSVFVRLKPIDERDVSQQELMLQARQLVQPYRKAAVIAVQGTGGLTLRRRPRRADSVRARRAGSGEARPVHGARAPRRWTRARSLVDVDRSFQPGLPELRLDIDRKRAADLGVRVQDVSQTVNALIAGQDVTTFNAASDQYEVVLKAQDSFRRTPESIASATVRTGVGRARAAAQPRVVQRGLGAGADRSAQPAAADHDLGQPGAGHLAGRGPGGARSRVRVARHGAGLQPRDERPVARARAARPTTSRIAFALSFVFMYMVLAAQFESFIHPVTILLTLPLAVPFGLAASLVFGQQLNIYSALGVLLLFGIVKKNAILQIDHTIGLRAKGLPRDEAIIQANRDRLRPILMTTLALVAGMMPLCLGSGPGAETNRSIGILVAGGQSLCLLLTLLAVPVFYSLFDDAAQSPAWARIGRRWERVTGAGRRAIGRLTGRRLAPGQGVDR